MTPAFIAAPLWFDLPEGLREELLAFLPKFRHGLLDLSQYDPASGEREGSLRVVLQLMRLARQKNLLEFFQWLGDEVARKISDDLLRLSLVYAFNVDGQLDLESISRSLRNDPELEDRTMTLAQKLKSEGRREGYALGILQTCRRLAGRKWGDLPVSLTSRVEALDYTALEKLSVDLLDLVSPDELRVWLDAHTEN